MNSFKYGMVVSGKDFCGRKAFFKSAITFVVDTLPYKEFSEFLKNKFFQGHRKIDDKVLEKAFQITLNILFESSGEYRFVNPFF